MPVSSPRRSRTTLVTLFAVAATSMGAFAAGCGENADQERLRAEEVAQAKAEGRREARVEQAAADAKAEAKKLRADLEKLKARQAKPAPAKAAPGSGGSSSSGASQGASTTAGAGGSTSCGDGLSVNAATSCPFARGVRSAYESSGGASVIEAYSPVTKQTYTMRCEGGVPTICSGGNGAVVYLR